MIKEQLYINVKCEDDSYGFLGIKTDFFASGFSDLYDFYYLKDDERFGHNGNDFMTFPKGRDYGNFWYIRKEDVIKVPFYYGE